MAPVNLMLVKEQGLDQVLMAKDAWVVIEFEVALGSGSVVHACVPGDCPGYLLQESPGSKRGQEFQMGDGGLIKKLGQKQLNLSDSAIGSDVQSVFQIAAVTCPLMSVGRIGVKEHKITFNNICAVVRPRKVRSCASSPESPEFCMSQSLNYGARRCCQAGMSCVTSSRPSIRPLSDPVKVIGGAEVPWQRMVASKMSSCAMYALSMMKMSSELQMRRSRHRR